MAKKPDIDKIRNDIDKIDEKIVKLLAQRGGLAKKIGQIKQNAGKEIYAPSRERQIFSRLEKINDGPYNDVSIRSIFREIISATRALEQPINVAFLGPEATFTHKAAVEHFGHSAHFVAQADIASVFREVEMHNADFGVVPIENSTEGVVNYTLDKFVESDLKICSEIIISVNLHLLSTESDMAKITKIYSHTHALPQCRGWISKHLPSAELHHADSTAAAAKKVLEEPGSAAIASSFSADKYNLNILAHNIQDQVNNFTRFLVLGNTQAEKTGDDKTSIAFVTKDKPGILYHLLKPLAAEKINLTKIESRPLKTRAWEYMFFVDLDGHASEKRVHQALIRLKEECASFKILGSYPKAVRVEAQKDAQKIDTKNKK